MRRWRGFVRVLCPKKKMEFMIHRCMARAGLRDGYSPVDTDARGFRSLVAFVVMVAGLAASAAAQVAVSDAGQATYVQPLVVPLGIAGMQPNLSLSFVQGSINGPLGAGWSVQGLSGITRCPATLVTDGRHTGVRYAVADKFVLMASG
jgi:hypothetical protein